jgi:uncharacterized SAM-binding protein YcdF (DUF218 family)
MCARRTCRLVGWAALLGLLVIAFTPLPNRIGGWLYTPARLGQAGAIVVLGGPDSEHRAVQGILLYRQGFSPLLIFSGVPMEVSMRESLARGLGLPLENILTERTAHTTREEALTIGALLRARGIRRILLVTDGLSMPRARRLFERAGLEVLPVPSTGPGDLMGRPQDQVTFALSIAEETVAYLYYWLLGYL